MAKLIEGRSRNHVVDVREASVAANTDRLRSRSQPEASSAFLHRRREAAVVDDLATNRLESAGFLERAGTKQYASSRGAGNPAARVSDTLRRIQQKEKVNERRNQELLRQCVAAQLHHQRRQIVRTTLRLCDEPRKIRS